MSSRIPARRSGTTLVELMVVLAILALVAGLTGVALRTLDGATAPALGDRLRALRRAAIESGRPMTGRVSLGGAPRRVTAMPDGRIIADSMLHVNPSTGAVDDGSR